MSGHDFVKLVSGWGETQFGPNMVWIDTSSRFSLEKVARSVGSTTYVPPELQRKIAEIQGKLPHDKVAFYNRALGSFESYGINKNGDGWTKDELLKKHATFVDNARYFRNHDNRDTSPSYGRPVASAYNTKTDMVDLIILADLDKTAEEDIQTLERGGSVGTSMGCRVKFDACTICGNRAPNRMAYCEHVKEGAMHPYGMGQVLSDGRVCGVMNPDPVFFDISRVTNPAFIGSENMLKVAHDIVDGHRPHIVISSARAAESAGLTQKTAEHCPCTPDMKSCGGWKCVGGIPQDPGGKHADMVKELPGRIDAAIVPGDDELVAARVGVSKGVACCGKKIPSKEMSKKSSVEALIGTSAAMGIVLSPEEFGDIFDAKIQAPTVERILSSKPMLSSVFDSFDAKLARELGNWSGDRSILHPHLASNHGGKYVKTSSSRHGGPAEDLYLAYRSGLLSRIHDAGGIVGEREAMKVAQTGRRMATKLSAAFALLAFCDADVGQKKEAMSTSQFLANSLPAADTLRCALHVSGSMADQFGEDVLDQMTINSLQSN